MVNTINTLTERNKELLNKIEELEREINSFPSREQQLEVLNRVENIAQSLKERDKEWKKEVSWMWKHKSYRLNTKTFKYHEKQATSEDGEYHSKIFISTAGFHLWDEEQKRSITEKDNPLESYLRGLIYQFSYLTGRAIGYEDKIKELKEELSSKGKLTREQKAEISKLSEELKKKVKKIEELEKNLEIEKESAKVHYEAIEICDNWYTKQPGCLKEKLIDKTELLQKTDKLLEEERAEKTKLKEELEEKSEILRKNDQRFENEAKEREELRQLYLDNKPLPSLPKKPNKFQKLGTKIKTKFQNLVKEIKHQEQKFIARVEVKVN